MGEGGMDIGKMFPRNLPGNEPKVKMGNSIRKINSVQYLSPFLSVGAESDDCK